jgi:hypothetical protein
MAIDFPNSPTNGQSHTVGSTTWIYNSAKPSWDLVTSQIGFTPTIDGGAPNENYGGIAALNAGGVTP